MQAFVFRRSSPGQMCPVVIQPPWFSNFSESFRLSYFLGWTSSYTYAWYQLAGMSQNICKCPTILTSILSYSSRAMTATLDKTSDSLFHDFILKTFGMTPFINTFPDFMAGGAVMITALFIAAGMEVCKKSSYSILKAESIPPKWNFLTKTWHTSNASLSCSNYLLSSCTWIYGRGSRCNAMSYIVSSPP